VQVEEVLNQESGLLDALMDSFPSEIFIKNKESQIVKVNKAFLQNKNQSSIDTVIGKTDFDYYNKAHAHKAYNDEQRIIRTGKPILNIEEKECYPDGKMSYINTSKMPLLNKAGDIIGTFGVSHDITKRKLHELELKEKTSILNAITKKMPVVIYKYIKGKGLSSLFGESEIKKAFEASKMAKLKIADSLNHFVDKIGSQKDKNRYFSFSSTSRLNKKERYFENFIFEWNAENGEFICLALDITERKLTEQKLKRDSKYMEKVNKELNQFAYIISHDLKAPLRAITNLSEWTKKICLIMITRKLKSI
jgi:PAS domain S-box-containing protein